MSGVQPRFASDLAIAAPMPLELPVINTGRRLLVILLGCKSYLCILEILELVRGLQRSTVMTDALLGPWARSLRAYLIRKVSYASKCSFC